MAPTEVGVNHHHANSRRPRLRSSEELWV